LPSINEPGCAGGLVGTKSGCAGGLVGTKSGCAGSLVETVVLFLPNHQHTLKMGTELSPETSETLYILTQLSDTEHFTPLIEDQVTLVAA